MYLGVHMLEQSYICTPPHAGVAPSDLLYVSYANVAGELAGSLQRFEKLINLTWTPMGLLAAVANSASVVCDRQHADLPAK
jgi:predicted DNA-binding ArsR family transcriptional regulator